MDFYVVFVNYIGIWSGRPVYEAKDEFRCIFSSQNEAMEYAKDFVGDGVDDYSECRSARIIHYTQNDGKIIELDTEYVEPVS